MKPKIMLDSGHGGRDSGAIGVSIIEKNYVLEVVKLVKNKLINYNCDVLLTREKDNYISLDERVNKSNINNCDIFVSIHCNSASNIATGFESYSFNGKSSLQENIHREVVKTIGLKDRGMKKANFYVLKYTKAKAVLLELGFINNKNDCDILNKNIEKIADSIVRGIVNALNLKIINTKYCVQIGAFNNKENAQQLVDELKIKGYEPIIKVGV